MLWKVLNCINTDKILPENMVKSDPIGLNSFIFMFYKKLVERMRRFCPVSDRKAKQVDYTVDQGSGTYSS